MSQRETLTVPQLGEGLREARILRFLKAVGETVRLDEGLYEMETEKAAVIVESAVAGRIVSWLGAEGEMVPIYSPIVEIETDTATVPDSPTTEAPIVAPTTKAELPTQSVRIPPRARAFARANSISDADLAHIPSVSGTLTEDDIKRYLAQQQQTTPATDYSDHPLSERQSTLNRRAFGDPVTPVPATVKCPILWADVLAAKNVQTERTSHPISEFQVLAYATARAAAAHPKLRSRLLSRTTVREYHNLDLGFAVRLRGDELTTAVVRKADALEFGTFSSQTTAAMRHAVQDGTDNADERTTLLVSYLGAYGVTDATPVLTAPAVAVLFIGAPFGDHAILSLTFDHRLINGVGAAVFLRELIGEVKRLAV